MNFTFTEEQTLLAESLQRFVQDHYDLDQRETVVKKEPGYTEEHWQTFAELGWLALPFSEDDGGIGGNELDTMLVMEEFGKGLVVEPWLPSVVLAGAALRMAATPSQRQKYIGGLIDGSLKGAVGWLEDSSRFDVTRISTRAEPDGEGFVINGAKSLVLGAAAADFIIIQARTGTDGISLFIVDKDAAGLKVSGYPTVDGLRAAEVTLKDVAVGGEQLLGEQNQGMDVLNEVTRQGLLAVCAEAVGIMENLYKDTVEYTRTREQFDHPLSEFQVLRHRMADMFVEYELCKSLLYRATMEKAEGAGTADQSLHALKVLVGKSGRFIAQNAVQLHGGMGLTEELRIGHYFKRMTVIESQFGGTDAHLSRYVKAMRQAL